MELILKVTIIKMEAKNREKIFINFKAYILQIHRVKVCGNDKVGIDNDRLAISLVRKIMGQLVNSGDLWTDSELGNTSSSEGVNLAENRRLVCSRCVRRWEGNLLEQCFLLKMSVRHCFENRSKRKFEY